MSTEVVKVQLPLIPRQGERWLALIYNKKRDLVVQRDLTPDERKVVGTRVKLFCHAKKLDSADWQVIAPAENQLLKW